MNILISGGSGFLGSAFSEFLHHEAVSEVAITWLSRHKSQAHPDYVTMMGYDELPATQTSFDVILNLAGAGIADKRWSDARKSLLFASRLKPTQAIIDYITRAQHKPKLLVSGSAIGWYGVQGDKPLDENSGFIDDFAHQLCDRWEAEATSALGLGVPVAILRTGVVIHPDGGMLERLLPPFKMGAGGRLGNGQQIMSWIGLEDWVRATWFIIQKHLGENEAVHQVAHQVALQITSQKPSITQATIYNLTAPNPISNAEFTKAVGDWLNRPTFMTLPEWLLKTMFGEMATLLIDGQKVLPKALLQSGFEFQQPTIRQALAEQK